MKMLVRNLKIVLFLMMLVFFVLITGLVYHQHRSMHDLSAVAGENKKALRDRYSTAGIIYDRDGVILAYSDAEGKRCYAEDPIIAQAMLHTVGDYTRHIGNTVESSYQDTLLGNHQHPVRQILSDLSGRGLFGDDVHLTLSADLSRQAYQALDGRAGAVVLLNYQTGEIYVAVSSPSVSPDNVVDYVDIPDTALFNRAFLGAYPPGSTFKIVTAYAYFVSEHYDPASSIVCHGSSTVGMYGASEDGNGHGTVSISSAFAKSCNVFWGQIGARLGRDALLSAAYDMGYKTDFTIDRLHVRQAEIAVADSPSDLSWIAIGQPVNNTLLSMTPLQMAMMVGAIGNDGIMLEPHLVSSIEAGLGYRYETLQIRQLQQLMAPHVALALEHLLIGAVENGTGSAAAVSGYTVAAKTGTVQVEGKANTALCVAYIVEDDAPFAVVVIIEEGGSGGSAAAPLAGMLLSRAAKIG